MVAGTSLVRAPCGRRDAACGGLWCEGMRLPPCAMAAEWHATNLAVTKGPLRQSGELRGPSCVWWVPRPSAGASSEQHASSSAGRLSWGGRQCANGINMGVAVFVAVAVAVATAARPRGPTEKCHSVATGRHGQSPAGPESQISQVRGKRHVGGSSSYGSTVETPCCCGWHDVLFLVGGRWSYGSTVEAPC